MWRRGVSANAECQMTTAINYKCAKSSGMGEHRRTKSYMLIVLDWIVSITITLLFYEFCWLINTSPMQLHFCELWFALRCYWRYHICIIVYVVGMVHNEDRSSNSPKNLISDCIRKIQRRNNNNWMIGSLPWHLRWSTNAYVDNMRIRHEIFNRPRMFTQHKYYYYYSLSLLLFVLLTVRRYAIVIDIFGLGYNELSSENSLSTQRER